jgi:hypothetical protein
MSESAAEQSTSAPDPDAAGSDQPGPDEPEFVNRAARRAKGKSGGTRQTFDKGQAPVGRGSVQSPRQYGTRRSG